jgi:hypothetical protein
MTQNYITQAEAYVLSFIAGGQFQAEDRQLYHDHVTPRLIRNLVDKLGVDDAIKLLQYIIDRIDIRYARAKDRRWKYELACYRSWLANAQGQIERDHSQKPKPTFFEAVQRIINRQQSSI